MSLSFQILGQPGRDNALFVQIDSGQAIERLLFDCGEGCLSELAFADLQAIDHLFFSHLHMDHVGGFDTFFRGNFNRSALPNQIWGPPETARILQHRFQGYCWNLHEHMASSWLVSDIHPSQIHTSRFELQEAFAISHDEGTAPRERAIHQGRGYVVESLTLDHRTPSLAYVVREKARQNIDTSRLASAGLRPGPWLKQLKGSGGDGWDGGSEGAQSGPASLVIDGVTHSTHDLRKALIVETPGDSIAYLTDFLLDESALERLGEALRDCRVIVCEAQYRHADLELARKHFHLTSVQAATVAQRALAEELVLFHLSERYLPEDWLELLQEARERFPNTHFPVAWASRP